MKALLLLSISSGLTLVFAPTTALGVVIGDHSSAPTAPIPAPAGVPHANGAYNTNNANASATYIGEGWFVGAAHAFGARNDIMLGGNLYTWDQSINGGLGYHDFYDEGIAVDLRLFRVNETVAVAPTPISSRQPIQGEDIIMVGTGFTGNIIDNGTPDNPYDDSFDWTGTRHPITPTAYWGTNTVEATYDTNGGGNRFTADFDAPGSEGATLYESQATNGDSGGGGYVFNNGRWELAGVLIQRTGSSGASRYGDSSIFLDITQFRSEILSYFPPTPEPSSALLTTLGAACFFLRRGR